MGTQNVYIKRDTRLKNDFITAQNLIKLRILEYGITLYTISQDMYVRGSWLEMRMILHC